jgi:hypothetical protein
MSYTSNYNLNIRLSALESRINNGVPTSSDLGDVLLNGNSAGTTDIDMNLQSVVNATSFVSGDNGNSIDVDGSSATLTIEDNLGNINVITAIGSSVPSPNADSILTTATTANATFYPTFLGATTGYNSAGVSTSLTFNPSTKTETITDGVNSTILTPTSVSSTTFTGGLSGNATSATNIAGGLGGSIPYQSAVDTTALLANGTSGQYLKSNGTTLAPSWATLPVNGINDVLATGNTATQKTLNMITGATPIDSINLTCSVPGSGSTQIAHNYFITGNGNKILNMDFDNGLTLTKVGATSLGYSQYTADELRIAPTLLQDTNIYNSIKEGSSVIYDDTNYASISSNTSTPISSVIADGINTSSNTSSLLSKYLTGSSTNSLSSSNLSNTALNIYDSASLLTYSSLTSAGLTLFNATNVKNVMTNASSVFYSGASTTLYKCTFSAGGFALVGSNINTTNTTTSNSLIINTTAAKNTLTSNSITQVLNADDTINKSVLTNSGLTLTGSTIGTTNTIVALTNTITDGVRTILSGISSSIATIKLNAAATLGNSTIIQPNSITNYSVDGATTTNYFNTTHSTTDMIGSSASYFIKNRVPVNTSSYGYSLNIGNNVTSGTTDFLNNAYICLESANTGTLLAGSVPSMLFRRTQATIGVGDTLGLINFAAQRSGGYVEYARISGVCRQRSATLDDGSLLFQVAVNSSQTSFLDLNGDVDKIVAYKPIIIDPTGGSATTNKSELTQTQLTIIGATTTTGITLNATQSTFFNGGLGCIISPTSMGMSGSGAVGGNIQRDASTTNSTFNAIASAGFTPDATVGAQINLKNSNTGAGLIGGNPIIYERTKATITTNDVIGSHHYWALDSGSTRREYARTTAVVKDSTAGSIDSSLDFKVATNSTLASMLELNGADNQIDALKPIDMNNNSIVSSTGGITLDTTASSGTGVITLNTKNGTAGSGTGLVLSGNTLTVTTSGPNVQEPAHLCLYLPDPVTGLSKLYKIQLLA